jgi:sulfite exporter TauE/SafE
MTSLILAIFAASVLGSLHCAGMCGAFVAIAVQDRGNWRRHASLQAAYHGGRLASYLSLGIAAGVAGRLLNLGGALAGIRSAAAVLAGITVIIFALLTLARQKGLRWPLNAAPAWLSKISAPIYRAAMNRPPMIRALIIGLCTTLLPCGWLYAFVITAAGTASPIFAAATMFAFWLGTLPMLVTMGAGVRSVLGPLQRRVPVATAIVLLAAGLYTIAGRARLDPAALGAKLDAHPTQIPVPGTAPCCVNHDGHGK